MADGIKRANSADPAKVRDALAATKDFPMLEGNLNGFNSLHEIIMPISVNVIKDGKFKPAGEITDLDRFRASREIDTAFEGRQRCLRLSARQRMIRCTTSIWP